MVRSERLRLNEIPGKAARLFIEFVIYSFIGWTYETVLTSIVWGEYADRGWLHLPLCPIYGFCAFFLLLILGKIKNVPLIFLAGTLVTTAAELAASYILDRVLEGGFTDLWDYYGWHFHFEGRIALGSSLIFGGMCVLLVSFLHPLFKKLIGRMKPKAAGITAVLMLSAIAADSAVILSKR